MATRFFPNYSKHVITSRFGTRKHPVSGEVKTHNGIDFNASPDGKVGQTDYILAHTGGVVESVGYGSSSGNYVRIRVDERTLMVYYHMKNPCKLAKGTKVKQGDRLGYVGKTGSATGPHLHWGIQLDGKWIDPEPYLNADWVLPLKMVDIKVPVLKRGMKNERVKAMQDLLIGLGYKMKKGLITYGADGSFGAATEAAVKKFQAAWGLEETGECDAATWAVLLGN